MAQQKYGFNITAYDKNNGSYPIQWQLMEISYGSHKIRMEIWSYILFTTKSYYIVYEWITRWGNAL